MTIIYNGEHSINFFSSLNDGSRLDAVHNTWRDWHLIPTKKPYVAPAQPEFRLMQIPASNAVMDLSDYYAGGMRYGVRSGDWEFLVDADKWGTSNDALNYFLANIHGKKLYCELTDNLGTAYCGRFAVTGFESSDSLPVLKISYQIFPTVGNAGEIVFDEDLNSWVIRYDDSTVIEDPDVVIDVDPFVPPDEDDTVDDIIDDNNGDNGGDNGGDDVIVEPIDIEEG